MGVTISQIESPRYRTQARIALTDVCDKIADNIEDRMTAG